MHYELWDTASRNLLDDFDSGAEALAMLAALLAENEPEMAKHLTLLRVGGADDAATVASDLELARMARAYVASRPS